MTVQIQNVSVFKMGPDGVLELEPHEREVVLSLNDDAAPGACHLVRSWTDEHLGHRHTERCDGRTMKRLDGERYPVCRSHMRTWLDMIGPIEAARAGLYPVTVAGCRLAYIVGKSQQRTWVGESVEALLVFADWLDTRGERHDLVTRIRAAAGRVATRQARQHVDREVAGQATLVLGGEP